ncbi:MAG: hypothetical protein B7Y40_03865 [Gammaproteobacteria bacterium 28-57-27]|nr:MAG: hypothetical protein B7Y40_03865 [Gammaproteobacteria bacterium 28-57-27]
MYFGTGKHSIRKIENLGETITLDDNSRWKVSFIDKVKSMQWLPTDDVNVSSYIGDKFNITHIERNETIEATHQQG